MRIIFLAVLFCAIPLHAQTRAEWVATPVPHWHCPDLFLVADIDALPPIAPYCQPDNPQRSRPFATSATQERIYWHDAVTVSRDGIAEIRFPDGFLDFPGCVVKGDEHLEMLIETKSLRAYRGTPGAVLLLNCHGLVNR
jgi:hypothetical protein